MNFNTELFGRTPEGEEVSLYTLTNAKGLRARITNYGAILVSLEVPDRHGKLDELYATMRDAAPMQRPAVLARYVDDRSFVAWAKQLRL